MLRFNKRAIMGIGTLIIFIATILVAAVAAGVLISTSGILQQRALITGQEARKKITNSIEIVSIIANGNKTDESLNDFEILIRLDAGSDSLQMKKFDLSWIGPRYDAAANLQHISLNDPNLGYGGFNEKIGDVSNSSETYISDLDDDNIMERVKIISDNASDSTSSELIVFNFSGNDADYFIYNLTTDISNISSNNTVRFEIENIPIKGQDGYYYGYFTLIGNITQNNTIDSSIIFNITANPDKCEFQTLAPEKKFCFEVMHGDNDLVLGDGEMLKLKYRLLENHRMFIGEEFRFIFSAEKGRLSQAQAKTPDVITSLKVPLWPVG